MQGDPTLRDLSRPLVPLSDEERRVMESVITHYAALPVMAWWRVPELILLRRIPMEPPILDLGCGDGRMAETLFGGSGSVSVGLDLSVKDTHRADGRGVHRLVVRANLQHPLPVSDGQFGTVFSNSVFEHVPGIEPVFAEIHRALRPGGRLVFTVPSEHLNTMLRYPRRIRRVLGSTMSGAWQRWWDRKVAHVNLGGEPHWTRVLAEAGLRLLACRSMLGPPIVASVERWQLLHDLGVGRANLGNLVRALTEGPARLCGWPGPLRLMMNRTRRRLEWLLRTEPCAPGANLLFVAERPG